MFAHAKQLNQTLRYRCLRNKNSVATNITMATGKATIPGGLGRPIRSTMKADTANTPKNAIAAMIRVETVAPRGSNNVTTRYNRVARNEYAAARIAIAIETWKTDPPIRFVTSPTAWAIKSITNPVPENHMTVSDGAGPRTSDGGFHSTLEYGFGSKQMSSQNELVFIPVWDCYHWILGSYP